MRRLAPLRGGWRPTSSPPPMLHPALPLVRCCNTARGAARPRPPPPPPDRTHFCCSAPTHPPPTPHTHPHTHPRTPIPPTLGSCLPACAQDGPTRGRARVRGVLQRGAAVLQGGRLPAELRAGACARAGGARCGGGARVCDITCLLTQAALRSWCIKPHPSYEQVRVGGCGGGARVCGITCLLTLVAVSAAYKRIYAMSRCA